MQLTNKTESAVNIEFSSEMAGAASRYPWAGTAGLWNSSWPPGSRNQNADSDTDSEHRRLREDREHEEETTCKINHSLLRRY